MAKRKKLPKYNTYWDCSYLLNSTDSNGNKCHVFVVVSSELEGRGAGKTYGLSQELFKRFHEKGELFGLICTTQGMLGSLGQGTLGEYVTQEEDGHIVEVIDPSKAFSVLYLEKGEGEEKTKERVGFCFALNGASKIKQKSSLFSSANVCALWMDEFMSRDNNRGDKDVINFKLIKDSVGRGGDAHENVREVDCIFSSNALSLNNSFLRAFGLSKRIQKNSRFVKAPGVVYENVIIPGLKEKHENTGLDIAMAEWTKQQEFGDWVCDDDSIVTNPDKWGNNFYMCTLVYNTTKLAVRKYEDVGIIYVNRSIDKNCKYVYNTSLDGNLNIPMLRNTRMLLKLRDSFCQGGMRCSDSGVQEILRDIFL